MRLTVHDAGALIGMLDESDAVHETALEALATIRDPLYTWPALTEAMHLLGETRRGQDALRDMVEDGVLGLLTVDRADIGRINDLMRQYVHLPMDFADAALVRVAERDGLKLILTFDKHFRVYRLPRRGRFVVIP
jgi:predicted nucleic acid-binding protein